MKPQLHLCLLSMLAVAVRVAWSSSPGGSSVVIAMPGCEDMCGNVRIPFPFGMGPSHCFFDPWFEIECNESSATPFLSKFNNVEVLDISLGSGFSPGRSLTVALPPLRVCSDAEEDGRRRQSPIDLRGENSPYRYSPTNVFMMLGCSGNAVLHDEASGTAAGCATVCHTNASAATSLTANTCQGVHCCQSPLLQLGSGFQNLLSYDMDFDHRNSSGSSTCLAATLVKVDNSNIGATLISTLDPSSTFPVELKWSWTFDLPGSAFHGYRCGCTNCYGNTYVPNGCQVPGDCKHCRVDCLPRVDGQGSISFRCERDMLHRLALILGPSISFSLLLLVIGIYRLYRFIRKRRERKRRATFFKRNGGLLLQQQLASNEGAPDETKIFTVSELDKATNHFNENRILGQGGQGTVYKGMLVDGRIVAIKKANLLDESQLEQFINEVVILSQINHRNVVKMLGCCLETEVPLLVYEFIPNGTLSEHIHDPSGDLVISWEMRLKIAADSASAIAYLHSSASIPIYHRDIKSSNILLDEKNRARVSDFGSSKTIAIDQTHLTTLVQGTLGYLDPEYFQSYQFTEKSDVYSFGVVLLEILTGKNPIYMDADTMEQKNLVTEFLFLTQSFRMSAILDPEVVKQAKEEELIVVV